MLITILKNDKLQMDHENTTFTLIHYWLESHEGWSQQEKQEAFDKILDSDVLRFQHMHAMYLAIYALRTPWLQHHPDLSLEILQYLVLKGSGVRMEMDGGDGQVMKNKRRNRSFGMAIHHFNITATKYKCEFLSDYQTIHSFMGIVSGIPIIFSISRLDVDEGDIYGSMNKMVGFYVGWSTGGLKQVVGRKGLVEKMAPLLKIGHDITINNDKRMYPYLGDNVNVMEGKEVGEDQRWGWTVATWDEFMGQYFGEYEGDVMNIQVKLELQLQYDVSADGRMAWVGSDDEE